MKATNVLFTFLMTALTCWIRISEDLRSLDWHPLLKFY